MINITVTEIIYTCFLKIIFNINGLCSKPTMAHFLSGQYNEVLDISPGQTRASL